MCSWLVVCVVGLGSNEQDELRHSEPRACVLNPAHTQIISWKNQKHETKIGKYIQRETQKEEY